MYDCRLYVHVFNLHTCINARCRTTCAWLRCGSTTTSRTISTRVNRWLRATPSATSPNSSNSARTTVPTASRGSCRTLPTRSTTSFRHYRPTSDGERWVTSIVFCALINRVQVGCQKICFCNSFNFEYIALVITYTYMHNNFVIHVRGVFQKFVAFDTRATDTQLKPTTFLYIISLIRNAHKPVVLQDLNY